MSHKRKKVSSETGSELDLSRMVVERMEQVSARTMDLMIMEMRKLDRWQSHNYVALLLNVVII